MMTVQNLYTETLFRAERQEKALPAFNIFNQQSLRGVLAAVRESGKPVILQPSTGTVKRIGAVALKSMIRGELSSLETPVLLHLDHCKDLDLARLCIDEGWDSVMVDFSHLPLEENIEKTQIIVAYAHPRNVAVEGEVGVISGVEDEICSDVQHLASFEDTLRFIQQTGVDAVAPACGTAHGHYKSEPCLNYDLIRRLHEASKTALVLHGGTGLTERQFLEMIACGITKINLSTVLKEVWYDTLTEYLPRHDISSPMKVDIAAEEAFQKTALSFIDLFSTGSKR